MWAVPGEIGLAMIPTISAASIVAGSAQSSAHLG